MEYFDQFIESLRNDEEKENIENHPMFKRFNKNQMLSKGHQQNSNDINKKKNDDEFMDGLIEAMHKIHYTEKSTDSEQTDVPINRCKIINVNLLPVHRQYDLRPSLPINDYVDFIPNKMKLSQITSSLGSKSHNNCDEKNPESDENLSEIIKKKRINRYFLSDSSSDEKSEVDENELEKEITELRRLSTRQKCVNVHDVSKKCKFFFKNFKISQSTAYVATDYMTPDIDLKYIDQMKNKLKSVYLPKRSQFYKKLVKTPKDFQVFSLKEGYSNIIADEGMVNLYDALKSFEKNHKYSIQFVKSKLGDALKCYSNNRDICWDIVHLDSNSEEDLLKYRLCYGAIPGSYVLELETIVCRLLVSKLNEKRKKSSNDVQNMQNKDYDLLEGELELIIFNYWQLSTRDMFGFKEHISRKKKKMVFYYMYKQLEKNITRNDFGGNEDRKRMFMNILKQFESYAAFENPKILTATGLFFVKSFACKLVPFLGKQYDLWSVFFHKFNLHSTAFDYTIKALLEDRDSIFQYLFTRVLEIDIFNVYGAAKSLWYHGTVQKVNPLELENTIISKTDVVNCLSYYFSKPTNVPRALCVKLDNYYFLYIDLFVSFIINNNLHKYHRTLSVDNCKHFFILNDRKYHDYYSENFIPTFETKRMVTSMQIMLNNLLNARLDGEQSWNMKMDTEVTHMFFELVHLHLNYTLTPAMLREGPALTDVQWASIFISDLNEMEMVYLEKLRWEDKPCLLSGAPDDFNYEPEIEDSNPLFYTCSVEPAPGDVTDYDDGNDNRMEFGPSSGEETDFNSDDSEEEGLDSVIQKILIEKKNQRLLAECEYLKKGSEQHEIFKRKVSKIIQDRIQRVGYFNDLTPKTRTKNATKMKSVVKVKVGKPPVNKAKGVLTLKAERDMVAAGVFEKYELKNDKTHVITPEKFKVFGLLSKNKIKADRKSSKGCTLCPNSKIASYNILVSKNVAVSCCLYCIEVIAGIIKTTTYSFETLQTVLERRIDFRFKSPILFDDSYQMLSEMPPLLSCHDVYSFTFNKLDPKYGKRLPKVDIFRNYCELENNHSKKLW